MIKLGSRIDTHFAPIARLHLERLARETAECSNLAVLDGTMVVYVAQAESPHPISRAEGELGKPFQHQDALHAAYDTRKAINDKLAAAAAPRRPRHRP